MQFTVSQLAQATNATAERSEFFYDHLKIAMARFEINTLHRVAAFLATVAIESTRLTKVEEDLYYKTPERLRDIYPRAFKSVNEAKPYVRNAKGLSELLYRGFHGRGLIQLTWERNYARASLALDQNYIGLPSLVLLPEHAALTAAWYWHDAGCNEAADADDMDRVTLLVNGPRKLHLPERVAQYTTNVELFA